ncbi:E3 ubiquitin-protein ligase TRIM33-like [Babylonia areolata]|uniref:E3 ubiquitin-protein ligase TRIM33-like n=1 Tax=Babylonia areolata TaxID=304850 RepID=UPI003FD1B7E0
MASAKAAYFEQEEAHLASGKGSDCSLSKEGEQHGSTTALNKRSMVLDEETFEDQFLRCHVCKDRFSPARMPKLLPCHHSFCSVCITTLYMTETQQRQNLTPAFRAMPSAVTIHCPACRASFVTTEENLQKLPTDHRVVQLMDFVRHTDRYTVTFCSKHRLQPLNFFCEPCVKPVCRDCTVLDHKESSGHLVMDLEEALNKYTPVLDSAIHEMETESISLEEKRVALGTALKALDKQRQELLEQLHTTFNRLRQTLMEREKDLEQLVHKEVDKEKAKLDEKCQQLSARRETLQDHTKTLKTAKEDCNVEEMFRIHQEVRDYRAGPPMKVREVDDGLMTSFSINMRDESLMMSRIGNFGDLTSRVEATCPRVRSVRPFTMRSVSSSTTSSTAHH